MRKRIGLALLLVLCMLSGTACAQSLPTNAVFSPGLTRLAALEGEQQAVWAEGSVKVDKALYARDLSVLSAMLRGTTFAYQASAAGETLSIRRDGETLGVYSLPGCGPLDALTDRLTGVAVLERVPLQAVAAWLEGLAAGDALGFGFAVSEPFTLERTMSDDGTRLTRLSISGAISRDGEAPYRIEGFLRQPAGRTPKDTFELTFTQDTENFIELSYSALRESEVTRKDREGTTSVRTSLKAAGKLAGSSLSSRLSVTMKNRWTADGNALSERITITASLNHEDRRPGRRMQRLNHVQAESKHTLRLTTHEDGDEAIALQNELALELTLDGTPFLAGSAALTLTVGGEERPAQPDARAITPQEIEALAAGLYQRLDPDTLAEIGKGL